MAFNFERWRAPADAPTLVGEMNPYGKDPRYAMFPMPEHSAGGRLCNIILNMQTSKYLLLFNRTNLCIGKWDKKKAEDVAIALGAALITAADPVKFILLGAKVCDAFGKDYVPFDWHTTGRFRYLILPHPSGRNRIWNNPINIVKARDAVVEFYPEIAPYVGLE